MYKVIACDSCFQNYFRYREGATQGFNVPVFYTLNYTFQMFQVPDIWTMFPQKITPNKSLNIKVLLFHFRAGLVPSQLTINLTKYLENEQQYVPWFSANKIFSAMDAALSTTNFYGHFRVSITDPITKSSWFAL